jgi:hypothetical protein
MAATVQTGNEICQRKFRRGTAFTRPLCVFPTGYKGTGDAADAGNWACVNGVVNDTTKDADAVLPDRGGRDPDDRDLD